MTTETSLKIIWWREYRCQHSSLLTLANKYMKTQHTILYCMFKIVQSTKFLNKVKNIFDTCICTLLSPPTSGIFNHINIFQAFLKNEASLNSPGFNILFTLTEGFLIVQYLTKIMQRYLILINISCRNCCIVEACHNYDV